MRWRRMEPEARRRRRVEAASRKGLKLAEEGRLDEAVAAFEAAARLAPEVAGIHLNLGSAYYRLAQTRSDSVAAGWLAEAAKRFEQGLALSPDLAAAKLNLAAAYSALGRHDEAVALLESARGTAADQADLLYNLAVAYSRLDRHKVALAAAEEALRRQPDHDLARQLVARLKSGG